MSIESVMPSNHLVLCHPLLLSSVFSSIRVFSSESALCIRWPKYWSFSFSISPCNEHSGLISSRVDCFDLLAVQGTLKSLLQHHSSKASNSLALGLLYGSSLTSVHDYWRNYSFDYTDICWQVMSLLFHMLSKFITVSSKEQASFNFLRAVTICSDFGAHENEVCHCFQFFLFAIKWWDLMLS